MILAAPAPGICWHIIKASTSNNSVNPLSYAANGTLTSAHRGRWRRSGVPESEVRLPLVDIHVSTRPFVRVMDRGDLPRGVYCGEHVPPPIRSNRREPVF